METCSNCGAALAPDRTGRCTSRDHKREFCAACSGIAQALAIGARQPVMLYDTSGFASDWMGARMGTITYRNFPAGRARFAAVRYRVRMFDGSDWYGHGPSRNGNYIRLRPMKGQ